MVECLSVLSALNSRNRGRESARALPPPRAQRIIHRFAASPQRAKGTHRPRPTARRISTTPARKRFSASTRLDNPFFIDGPDVALHVWVAEQQEDNRVARRCESSSCSCVTQTLKAASGPPRRWMLGRWPKTEDYGSSESRPKSQMTQKSDTLWRLPPCTILRDDPSGTVKYSTPTAPGNCT